MWCIDVYDIAKFYCIRSGLWWVGVETKKWMRHIANHKACICLIIFLDNNKLSLVNHILHTSLHWRGTLRRWGPTQYEHKLSINKCVPFPTNYLVHSTLTNSRSMYSSKTLLFPLKIKPTRSYKILYLPSRQSQPRNTWAFEPHNQ